MFISLLTLLLVNTSWSAESWRQYSLINSCNIYNLQGEKIKSFPGKICQFFDDGSYLSADDDKLYFFAKGNQEQWQVQGPFHHQINLSLDKKRILALASKLAAKDGSPFRIDRFLVLDLMGKVLHQQDAENILHQINQKEPYSAHELAHFNSFYEIPKIEMRNPPPYLKEGNFIVNSYHMGLFILSSDLQKVLFHKTLRFSDHHNIHDAQILSNGHLLYFNNHVAGSGEQAPYSAIQEIDLLKNKVVHEVTAQPKPLFFSRHCGGVQILDQDHMLFSHQLTGTYIYSKKQKKITHNLYQTHLSNGEFYPSQQVKAQDLTSFLEHWK